MLEKEFELKYKIIGPGIDEVTEEKFLGRTIRWTPAGIEYEGDRKHAEILIKEWQMTDSKAVATPGVAEEKAEEEKDDMKIELNKEDAKQFRRGAARVNYMALDRADLAFAAKNLSKGMANPTVADVMKLKRTIRFLKGRPRAVMKFVWQDPVDELIGMTDSDWAGCTTTRKSTSGGLIFRGKHLLAHWSSTQATVALSSGEAELNSIVKIGSEMLGIKGMLVECGHNMVGVIRTDSSAASGIAHRRGCGKVKHLEARQLWIQDVIMSKKLSLKKIPRSENSSDALTHHWLGHEGARHFPELGLEWRL